MKNAWGFEIPRIDEITARSDFQNVIGEVTQKMLLAVGHSTESAGTILDVLFDRNSSRSVLELEKLLHEKIVLQGKDQESVQRAMCERARIISSQIEKYFVGESLADIGCGHGLVGWTARKHFNDILLLDIVDYRFSEVKLPFVGYTDGEAPPFGHPYDCTLLITVLHHASDPLKLLLDVWRQTRQRLIVIESVFGVYASRAVSPLPHLDQEAQLSYAVFCDWFYNRVLNQGVSVPYNFNTPDNWREIFTKLPARLSFEEDLGVDLDVVPEHHVLFVLDANRQ